ncbi:TPA: Phr family secreted Rap phosphatase inhibitor [Bacillus pacificus]|jgi:Phr family secreted Rap phosphatase inhibitor|uniref:Phr family secreted Rap phosphatase inhibitor n=1 Tax=Bacillus TaxID=1386 RepID=UPI0029C1ECC7|nr:MULTISPECIES: Phr family secreted Rap phosphatase inhibitor [unclassified Bacillus cereus group]MDX5840797.1 Phr family secreted Rap phosphatase inhibitor [Bacillus cereus group sp. BfR-BA-01700]MDX5846210.1 Phr family secreted Rap phosphatase inhibitor [Bacillus cereus group sp. BfR-BA-01233]MDX5941832.1 Phr family secreted Rap phosphatase inhibitor [Bacillus cereus group sp. BfR-BA-00415]
MKKIAAIVLGLSFIGFLTVGTNTDDKSVAYGDYPAPMMIHSGYDGAHVETI